MVEPLKILHIEDDFADAMLLNHAMCDAGGYHVEIEVVRSLFDARFKLKSRTYDLIVIDLRLPDSVDPVDTVRTAETLAKGTPILVLTGSARVDAKAIGEHIMLLDKNDYFNTRDTAAPGRLLAKVQEAAEDMLRL
ncbi:response regulator [Glycocaulis profundi]|nr:response regulator [Glycocaulis profundi]